MRIFIDCTHTAKYTYKNTGIHRVVRELTAELLNIRSRYPDIEVITVMFDGYFIRRVTTLDPDNPSLSTKSKPYLNPLTKISKELLLLLYKAKNKFINRLSFLVHLLYLKHYIRKDACLEFEGCKILPEDIYVIADANWDLPKNYYNFLKKLKLNKVTITIICYDLIPIKFPNFCSKKFAEVYTQFYVDYSKLFDKVLCISKNSAEDYKNAQNNGLLANNTNVIIKNFRLGCNYSNSDFLLNYDDNNCDVNLNNLLSKRYILVVGSLVPHKNIKAIIEAFNLLINSNREDIYLVFAGNKGWHPETDMLIESDKMYGKLIHIFNAVTDSQLKILYKHCYCLVQASFYEGFGLPVVEALQYGKPVISSNGGSLPEVGGEFCVYFDPYQPVELYQTLEKLIDSDIYYNHLVDIIKNKYKPFSWKECAEEFLSLLCS
ncbi:glycosyltransferase family 4 protein [Anabaena lutea]|uniref:Glycosyltransferase family 4 protein n=1 Tax=Anabaena lutea FACHB-196 TaxID=2692881 RepID=A0ABR8F9Z8_9NOST|nr:glycosyltransferase family 1 protein [Anabaena lutea]MBD2566700.1 glycosyltransferase family 4 protein [Anabaena lutea FACHB-196]